MLKSVSQDVIKERKSPTYSSTFGALNVKYIELGVILQSSCSTASMSTSGADTISVFTTVAPFGTFVFGLMPLLPELPIFI